MARTSEAQEAGGAPFTFFFGPFRFESDIDMPESPGTPASGAIAVRVRLGEVPDFLPGAVPFGAWCEVATAEYLLRIPGTARFYVFQGKEVRVEIEPGAPLSDVNTYLLGSVFGALCHQNGLLPLHASAVSQHGQVTAFLGNSGAGKSTMAAFLQRRGYSIVADDICLLEPDGRGVIPVAGWLKLWRESFEHLGQAPEERNRVFREDDKYRMLLGEPFPARPQLRNLVFLERAESSGSQPALRAIPAAPALASLMQMAYLAYIPELTGAQPALFRRCAQALSQASAFRLTVPWGWNNMDAVLALLEDKLFHRDGPG